MNAKLLQWAARAKSVIPGGSMLVSKRHGHICPYWPSHYFQASGCRITDHHGQAWLDMSLAGIGCCPLGYAHPVVESAVMRAVQAGVSTTICGTTEVKLAEKLIQLHPWADQAILCRSGGEAMAVAIRLARAATGRTRVLAGGYHGWHDWHRGGFQMGSEIPQPDKTAGAGQSQTVLAPTASDPWKHHSDWAARVLDLSREADLGEASFACKAEGSMLVYDEISSGFRDCLGGKHMEGGPEPDLAVFGKALGNGHAIAAVIGTREAMEAASRTFVSSTMWTESVGPAAALATIEEMSGGALVEARVNGVRMAAIWRRHGLAVSDRITSWPSFALHSPGAGDRFSEVMARHLVMACQSYCAMSCHGDDEFSRYGDLLPGALEAARDTSSEPF